MSDVYPYVYVSVNGRRSAEIFAELLCGARQDSVRFITDDYQLRGIDGRGKFLYCLTPGVSKLPLELFAKYRGFALVYPIQGDEGGMIDVSIAPPDACVVRAIDDECARKNRRGTASKFRSLYMRADQHTQLRDRARAGLCMYATPLGGETYMGMDVTVAYR